MGDESKSTQSQQSTTEPWKESKPALGGILGGVQGLLPSMSLTPAEQAAFGQLSSNAGSANRFAPQINSLATDLLNGGNAQGVYDTFKGSVTPYTTMDTNPYSNEAFTKFTNFLSGDIMDRIKGQYAGAGYSPTGVGDFGKTVGEGIAKGVAPAWLQASNDLENRKMGAIGSLYDAGNTTGGILNSTRLAGVDAANSAINAENAPAVQQLAIEAQKRGIPLGVLAALAGITTPIASLGGQSQGTAQGTNQMSGAQRFNLIASGIGSMMPKFSIGV